MKLAESIQSFFFSKLYYGSAQIHDETVPAPETSKEGLQGINAV
jgi:hypothetical protein